jgi:hypothetical protein
MGPFCTVTAIECEPPLAAMPRVHYPAPYERCALGKGGGPLFKSFSQDATDQRRAHDKRGIDMCCYGKVEMRPMGRPLREGGRVVLPSRTRARRTIPRSKRSLREVPRLVARRYREMASIEASSVAAFDALQRDMLRLAAPAELIDQAMRARADEAEHTASALAIAAAIDGRRDGFAPLCSREAVSVATLVREAVLDGCIGESIGALEAAEASRVSVVPEIVAHHQRVAVDEARHAELAFRWLAWLIDTHPEEAYAALQATLNEIGDGAGLVDGRPADADLEAFSLLDERARRNIARRVHGELVALLVMRASARTASCQRRPAASMKRRTKARASRSQPAR